MRGDAVNPKPSPAATDQVVVVGRTLLTVLGTTFSAAVGLSLAGLADAIVDLVSSGNTLKANGLVEVEKIADISSRLVVNQAALKLKREAMRPLIDALEKAVQA